MNDDPDDEREEEHAQGLLSDHSVSSSEYTSSDDDEEVLLLPNDGRTEFDLSGEDSFLTPSGNSPGYKRLWCGVRGRPNKRTYLNTDFMGESKVGQSDVVSTRCAAEKHVFGLQVA